MNLLLTLFGGMTLTALLYGLARGLRWSNFWAAVVAAAVPCFIYMGWVVVSLPSVDRITMHLVAFPTIAVLLYQLYRGGAKTHWIPVALVAFFVLLSILMGGFVYIASEGLPPTLAARVLPNAEEKPVYTGFSGVVAHHDEAAKSIAHRRNMENLLERRGWRVDLAGLERLQLGQPSRVSLRVTAVAGSELAGSNPAGMEGIAATLELSRPGQPALHTIRLTSVGLGDYQGEAAALESGIWIATLVLAQPTRRSIRLEQAIVVSR